MNYKTKLYDHQKIAFEKFRDSEYFALFADMGTGKSKIAIDICAYHFQEGRVNACLIIAPNNVHAQWIREQFPEHCPVNYRPLIWSSGKRGKRIWDDMLLRFLVENDSRLKVLAVNVEAFQSDSVIPTVATFVKNHKVFIIVDEATRIKNREAKRTKTIHRLNKYGIRCILTGTPTAKSPFDLWSQMEFLSKNYFHTSYFVFQHRYGVLMTGVNEVSEKKYKTLINEKMYNIVFSKLKRIKAQRGGTLMPDDYEVVAVETGVSEKNVRFIEHHPEYTRYKRLDELKAIIAPDVFSVTKAECLDLPPKVYEKIYVDMSKEQRRIYMNLKYELLAQYEDKELTIVNKVALTLRLMQVIGGFFPFMREEQRVKGSERYTELVGDGKLIGEKSVKFEAIRADLEEVPDEQRIIIWAHFVPELKMIYNELKKEHSCCLYYGGTSADDRLDIIECFKAGKYKIFIGNAATAGFGLNLQNATLQYYYSNTFRVEERLQAEDRSHRIGVKSTVVYKDIIMKGTVDEKIFANIKAGRDLNDFFKRTSLHDLLEDTDEVL